DPKHDSVFILNAMSDGEDDPEQRLGDAYTIVTVEPERRSLKARAATDGITASRNDCISLVFNPLHNHRCGKRPPT
ncbi:hypothetical protein BDR03DRAFT_879625, partial [Suillus americanus]